MARLKIISSTDPKLSIQYEHHPHLPDWKLPQIPQSFIEEYCKAGGIEKVMVECKMETQLVNGYKNQPKSVIGFVAEYEPTGNYKPIKDSNNCITIHPVEEKMYSREDVINIVTKAIQDTNSAGMRNVSVGVAEWLKENL